MELNFDLQKDDYLAFAKYYFQHSAAVKKLHFGLRIAFLSLLWVWLACIWYLSNRIGLPIIILIGMIITPLFHFYIDRVWLKTYLRRVAKTTQKEDDKFFGHQCLTIVNDGLSLRTSLTESKFAWAALGEIASTEDHTFIYIGSMKAIIIPHKKVSKEDYVGFMTDLQVRYVPEQILLS